MIRVRKRQDLDPSCVVLVTRAPGALFFAFFCLCLAFALPNYNYQ